MKTLEITTAIGCPNECAYCPQSTLLNCYDGTRLLNLDNFRMALASVPQDVRIDFSGFCEPFANPSTFDMVRHAHRQGHKVAVFTTAVGLRLPHVAMMRDIPFETFELHLQDGKGLSKIHSNDRLYEVIGAVKRNLKNVVRGDLSRIRPFSRAGNVSGISHPVHEDGQPRTCRRGWERFVMLPNGDLQLCCMDYGLRNSVGNLFRQTYEEVVRGVAYRTIRRQMEDGGLAGLICQRCEEAVPV